MTVALSILPPVKSSQFCDIFPSSRAWFGEAPNLDFRGNLCDPAAYFRWNRSFSVPMPSQTDSAFRPMRATAIKRLIVMPVACRKNTQPQILLMRTNLDLKRKADMIAVQPTLPRKLLMTVAGLLVTGLIVLTGEATAGDGVVRIQSPPATVQPAGFVNFSLTVDAIRIATTRTLYSSGQRPSVRHAAKASSR